MFSFVSSRSLFLFIIAFFIYLISFLIFSYSFLNLLLFSFLWPSKNKPLPVFFPTCVYLFYFDAFHSSIFLHYSLQFLCVQVFFICNENIEFTFTVFYSVSFCTAGVTCSFILYSCLVGLSCIIFFSFCFCWACICPLLEIIPFLVALFFICFSALHPLYLLISVIAL